MNRNLGAVLLATLVVAAPLGLAADLFPDVIDRFFQPELPPPPTLQLTSPQDGGVVGALRVAGEAHSAQDTIRDVQMRIDGGAWSSLPDVLRGSSLATFEARVSLTPGHHVIQLRAHDGHATSIVHTVRVAVGAHHAPPTLDVLSPQDGEGMAAGTVDVRGLVRGPGVDAVRVAVGDAWPVQATLVPGELDVTAWSARVQMPIGEVMIHVTASGSGGEAVTRSVTVSTGSRAPPTLFVQTPVDGASFGSHGDATCFERCIRFAGTATGDVAEILMSLNGGPMKPTHLIRAGDVAAWSQTLAVSGLTSGVHRASFVAVDAEGFRSVARHVDVVVRTPLDAAIVGDDAPRPSHTPLSFRFEPVEQAAQARWFLDGSLIGRGPEISVTLPRHGVHQLVAITLDAKGHNATARLALHAINRAPEASLADASGTAREPIALVAQAQDVDGKVVAYRWDMGDGRERTSQDAGITHTYLRAGLYKVTLTAIDDVGATSAPSVAAVLVENKLPVPLFTWDPKLPTRFDVVRFQDLSHDADGAIVQWAWTFGDGHTSRAQHPEHTFLARGEQLVRLEVIDDDGGRVVHEARVVVDNVAPVVAFVHEPQTPQTGDTVVFKDASQKQDGAIVSWSWQFGDEDVTKEGSHVRHVFEAPGAHPVMLTVVDDFGTQASQTVLVHVADAPPVIADIVVSPERPFAQHVVQFRAGIVDAEGGALDILWEFGDGVDSTDEAPAHRYARSGLHAGTLSVTDAAGQLVKRFFTVDVQNAHPSAVLRLDGPVYASVPFVLEADAMDPDGRIVRHAFDVTNDGTFDCDGPDAQCRSVLQAPGMHTARLVVEDDEGATAEATLSYEVVSAPPGWLPPKVRIDAPVVGATLRGELLLSGTATAGAHALDRVQVQLRNESWTLAPGGFSWALAQGAQQWRLLLDTRSFPDGEFTLVVRVLDVHGASGEARVPVWVQNDVPTSRVMLHVANLEEGEPMPAGGIVRGMAWHPEGVTSVRWRIADGPWHGVDGDARTWGIRLPELPAGEHVLVVAAYRGVHESSERSLTFVVPPPPSLEVTRPPGSFSWGKLFVEGKADRAGAVLWRLDGRPWQEVSVEEGRWRIEDDLSEVSNGRHVLHLKARSVDGAQDGEAHRLAVTVRHVETPEATPQSAQMRETPAGGWLVPLAGMAAAICAGRFGKPSQTLSRAEAARPSCTESTGCTRRSHRGCVSGTAALRPRRSRRRAR